MKSHDLAKKLLELPNKEVVIVCSAGKEASAKGYTLDMQPSLPWDSGLGEIRIQAMEQEYSEAKQ